MDNNFIKSNYSIKELEQFRDGQGFIDLSLAGIKLTESSREKKGTAERIKNWVNFNGTKALIRGNAVENFSVYAELLVEELAIQAGLEAAHYDIVKIKTADDKYEYGVLSEAMLDLDKEELYSLHDFIGDEPEEDVAEEDVLEMLEYTETTRYDFTIEKLVSKLQRIGYSEEEIDKIVKDYQKRLVFALKVIDTDKHPENISFVKKEDGSLELSPVYDNEISLLLDRDQESLEYFIDSNELGIECDSASPRIGVFVSKEDGGLGSMWKDTLERLCEDDEIYDFYESLRELDIDEAIENVEKRINAKLPEMVEFVARRSFKYREKQMAKVMGDEEIEPKSPTNGESGLDFLIGILNKGMKSGVRMAEQVSIGSQIEEDLKRIKEEVNLENSEPGDDK